MAMMMLASNLKVKDNHFSFSHNQSDCLSHVVINASLFYLYRRCLDKGAKSKKLNRCMIVNLQSITSTIQPVI